ncbi:MAG: class I SAM-dependent methyltransferase [Pirellula sp.]|jgi:SAM-dependent methyltransferase|nr:class I SAM-dependent methyltransferase [Pirellula sp.]
MNQAISIPSVSIDHARQAQYEQAYQSSNDPWDYASSFDQVRFATIADVAKRWCPTPKNSLEVACGLGYQSRLLAEFAETHWAYDFAPSAVQQTRLRCSDVQHKVRIDVRDALSPGYSNSFFDLIVMADIAMDENEEWWLQVLANAKNSLRDNGIMVVSGRIKEPSRREFENRFAVLGMSVKERIYFHDRYWFKFRSLVKRVFAKKLSMRLLSSSAILGGLQAIGRLQGVNGSIHFGVVAKVGE